MSDSKEAEVEKTSDAVGTVISVTEEEKELAANAYDEFQAKNYDSCKTLLSKLQTFRASDPKVIHNKAVSDYYASNFMKTEQFRKRLADVCKQARISVDKIDALEDVDHCVIFFNQAVILFHLHQYHAAISILDKLFQFIEPIDEHLARKVCFLLLELYLSTHQPEKALGLVAYVENMLFGGGNNNKRDSDGKTPTPEKDGKEKETRESSKEKEISDFNPNEHYRPKLQHYKARCYIMLKSTKACKREIKSLMNSGVSVPAIFLRSQLEYLRGNYKKSLKVLNTAFSSTCGKDFKDSGDNLAAMYYNNMGCIHFYMGKPNLGCFYLSKAVQEHKNAIKSISEENEDPLLSRPLHALDITSRYQMLYNLGIQYLHAGKYQMAFDSLVEAIQIYHSNPRLWLRIAECCIQNHKSDNSLDFHLKDRRKDMVQGVLGTGIHRKIILTPCLSNHDRIADEVEISAAMPALTLQFASLCLTNALILLPDETSPQTSSASTEEMEAGSQPESILLLAVPPANSLQKSEAASLRNSVLVCSSYVSLCLGDIVMALKHAETLLTQPRLCGAHRFLAHLYAAESLVLLDRIGDAIQHLNCDFLKDVSLSLPPLSNDENKMSADKSDENTKPNLLGKVWYPTSVSTAKVVLQYNLAVAYTLRGELEKASELLKLVGNSKGPNTDIPAQVIMLAIYIQLHQGHADLAKSIIRQHLPQYKHPIVNR